MNGNFKLFQIIEESVKEIISRYNFKFDRTVQAKVISISPDNKHVKVLINGSEINCTCHRAVGKELSIGDIVSATYESNNNFPRIHL